MGTFRPYRGKVAIVGARDRHHLGLGVVNPLLIKQIFDKALFGHPLAARRATATTCPNMHVCHLACRAHDRRSRSSPASIGIGQTYLANFVGLRVMQDLRNSLYKHLQYMPLRFFTSTRTGEIQSRLANDVGGVQSVVTDTASSILSNIVIIVEHAGRDAPALVAAHGALALPDAGLRVAHRKVGRGAPGGRQRARRRRSPT